MKTYLESCLRFTVWTAGIFLSFCGNVTVLAELEDGTEFESFFEDWLQHEGTTEDVLISTAEEDLEILAEQEILDSGEPDMTGERLEKTVTTWRMYDRNAGEHLYTGDFAERDYLTQKGWIYEGSAWSTTAQKGEAVYRLLNPDPVHYEHHYTKDLSEIEYLESTGWLNEGIAWLSDVNEAIPVYRLFNTHALASYASHHYTTDEVEREYLIRHGWNDEDIAWYVVEAGIPVQTENFEEGLDNSGENESPEENDISGDVPDENSASCPFAGEIFLLYYGGETGELLDLEELGEIDYGNLLKVTMSDTDLGALEGQYYRTTGTGTNVLTLYYESAVLRYRIISQAWAAHRGYLDMAPENTMSAFREASEAGALIIETDLRITADGVPVLMHDETVDDMTDGSGKIAEMTWEELKKLHIENGNGLEKYPGETIPTLEEYLAWISRTTCIADIELKRVDDLSLRREMVTELVRLIEKYGMQTRTVVTTFDYEMLQLFYECRESDIALEPLGGIRQKAFQEFSGLTRTVSTFAGCTVVTSGYCPAKRRENRSWTEYHDCQQS